LAAAEIAARIHDVAPTLSARSAEYEAIRRIPIDVIETLRSIGIFRMYAPRKFGGLELDLPLGLDIMAILSRIDGSLGWTAMIGSGSAIVLPSLPLPTLERVYASGPDVICGGSAQPAGTAEAVPGGFRVNGRWPFASGCQHADWLFALCVMTRDGEPLPGPMGAGGPPLLRAVALPASEFVIEDTWFATGLRGTGSHHITLKDKQVAPNQFCDFPDSIACLDGPLYQSILQMLPQFHCAFSVGVARGALDDLLAMAASGRRQQRMMTSMRDSETFQYELGRVATDIAAAEFALQGGAAELWAHAVAGTLRTDARLAESTALGGWLAGSCSRAADICFTLGGGSAVYDSSPLQRRMRDLHAAAQHATIHQRHFTRAGQTLLAEAVTPETSDLRLKAAI
jgi:alkylation response protein AidB-like acyl-CoA dehydrogenase